MTIDHGPLRPWKNVACRGEKAVATAIATWLVPCPQPIRRIPRLKSIIVFKKIFGSAGKYVGEATLEARRWFVALGVAAPGRIAV